MAVLIGLVSISVCPSFAAPHDGVKAHDASKTMELAGRRAGIGRFKRQLASAADELKLFLGLSASERVTEPDPDTSELSTRAVVKLAYPPSTGRPPSRKWTWTLGPYRIVPNKVDAKYSNFYHVTPDCFVPVIPSSTGSGWVQFWSESSNYRTTSTLSPFFEDAQRVDPNHLVFGGAYNGKGYDNGGKWLMSIFRHPIAGGANLVGFYHAQDNYGDPLNGAAAAWKSIGVAYSSDDGKSWRNGGLIVTSSKPRPPDSQAQFGGVGDFGSVWDYVRKQWVMYYGGNHWLSIAISKDPAGRPGTWWKYAGPRKGFTQKGLGGTEFPPGWNQLPDLSMDWARGPRGIAIVPGSNPGMHYNFYLAKWVMIWNSWDGKLYISANADISNPQGWETPRLFATSIDKTKAWHATVISKPGGSAWGGASTRVYYADRWRKPDIRDFVVRTLVFKRLD